MSKPRRNYNQHLSRGVRSFVLKKKAWRLWLANPTTEN